MSYVCKIGPSTNRIRGAKIVVYEICLDEAQNKQIDAGCLQNRFRCARMDYEICYQKKPAT